MVEVPCNGSTACCKNERIILNSEYDDAKKYKTVPTRQGDGPVQLMLQHKPNGDCVYLEDNGCTIHGEAPWACRMFDCRCWLLGFPEEMQKLLLPDDIDGEVVKAARARL